MSILQHIPSHHPPSLCGHSTAHIWGPSVPPISSSSSSSFHFPLVFFLHPSSTPFSSPLHLSPPHLRSFRLRCGSHFPVLVRPHAHSRLDFHRPRPTTFLLSLLLLCPSSQQPEPHCHPPVHKHPDAELQLQLRRRKPLPSDRQPGGAARRDGQGMALRGLQSVLPSVGKRPQRWTEHTRWTWTTVERQVGLEEACGLRRDKASKKWSGWRYRYIIMEGGLKGEKVSSDTDYRQEVCNQCLCFCFCSHCWTQERVHTM